MATKSQLERQILEAKQLILCDLWCTYYTVRMDGMLVVTDSYFCSQSAVKVTNYRLWEPLKGGATECYCGFVGKYIFFRLT
jgi:hypothetical protein